MASLVHHFGSCGNRLPAPEIAVFPLTMFVVVTLDCESCLSDRRLRHQCRVYQQWLTVFAVKDLDNDLASRSLCLFQQRLHFFGLTEAAERILHSLARDVGRCPAWAAKFELNSRSLHTFLFMR